MWDARNISSKEVMRLVSAGLRAGDRRETDFLDRVCESVDKVRAVSRWVDQFFEDEFRREPPPQGATLAVFAPGSAARLEFWAQRAEANEAERNKRDKKEKERRSDLDILCIVDGWPARDRRRTCLMKRFSDYLQFSSEKPRVPGVPIDFSSVWLDRMSKLPHGRFRDKECLVNQDPMRIRKEDKRFEMWRYWVVFESALLYSYPKDGKYGEDLEEALARSFFALDSEMKERRFPLIWYHAACRYMSEIYLSTLRDIIGTDNTADMMKKALKLKSVRVLNWSLAVINTVVIHQLAYQGLAIDAVKWRNAKSAGLISSLRLQKDLTDEIARRAGKNSPEELQEEILSISEALKALGPAKNTLLDAYENFFKWQEGGSRIPDSITEAEVWEFLQGQPSEKVPLTGDVINIIRTASELFRLLSEEAGRVTHFVPDFLFY